MPTRNARKSTTAATEPLLRLMYCSISAPSMTRKAFDNLCTTAAANNLARGITGTLVTNHRLNIQFLEGPAPALRALWERLQTDTRHHCLVQLYEEEVVDRRWFPDSPLLRVNASRPEMLAMVRGAYLKLDTHPKPAWSQGIAPLMILMDGEFSHAYTDASREQAM
jgi:Sensors of blue-light using FAD